MPTNKIENELPITGLNLDVEPEKQPKGTYRFALNITSDSSDGSQGSIVNEEGNTLFFTLPTQFKLIGHININNGDVVIISTNETTSFSSIGILSTNGNYEELISTDCLPFNLCNQVKGEFKIRNGCERIITLYDCRSRDLYLNLDRLDLYYNEGYRTYLITNPNASPTDYLTATNLTAWDCNTMNFNQDIPLPCLEFNNIIEGAGNTEVGVYKFKLELLDASFTRIGLTLFTQPIPISDESLNTNWLQRDGGLNSEIDFTEGGVPITRNAIQLRVDNLAPPVAFVRLIVKYYNNSDGVTNSLLLKPQYLPIDNLTTITFEGRNPETDLPFTNEEATTPMQVYRTSCAQEQINNRLVRANLTEQQFDWAKIQQLANNIQTEFSYEDIPAEINGEANTKSADYYAFKRSYMRDEVYAFGIVLKLRDGSYSPAFHIPGRTALTRTDNIPSYIISTPTSVIDHGNTNTHQRNQVPSTENNWDTQLLEVYPNPVITAVWTDQYSQHLPGFDPQVNVILDNVEHLGITDNTVDFGFGLSTTNNWTLVPRWMVFNTAILYSANLTSRGIMAYHEDTTTRYPRIRDCDGNFIYPVDATDSSLTAFVRHHKFPDADLVQHFREVGLSQDSKKIFPMGIIFETEAFYNGLPTELREEVEGHIFVRVDRTTFNKTVIDKGIYSVAQENWRDGIYSSTTSPITSDRVPGTYYDPLRYEPIQDQGLDCSSSVGMFYSPQTLFNRGFPGTIFNIKHERVIKPEFVSNSGYPTGSGNVRNALEYIDATEFISPAYCFFDLKTNLRYPYGITQNSLYFNVPDTGTPVTPIPISPHYRARFINRRVTNSRLLSPETNVDMDIEFNRTVGANSFRYRIVQFKNILQTNPVLIFEKPLGLPRGILSSTSVSSVGSLPHNNDGQAGWNLFYVGIKLNRNVYSDITNLNYIPISTCITQATKLRDNPSPVYGGDIFITRFTYALYTKNEGVNSQTNYLAPLGTFLEQDLNAGRTPRGGDGLNPGGNRSTYSGTEYDNRTLDSAFKKAISKVITTYVESEINVNLRHSGTDECNVYFEKNFDLDTTEYFNHLEDTDCPDFLAYNPDYSVITNEEIFRPIPSTFNFCLECANEYPNRIAWSPPAFETELTDNWRINRANDFIDIQSQAITNLKFDRNQLLILSEESLLQMIPNPQVLQTDIDSIQVGTGDFLSIPPREYIKKSIGYAGNQGRFNAVSSEFGWTWVDQAEGKVFNHTGQGLQEISKRGLYHWFRNNLDTHLDKQLDYPCIDNTSNIRGLGLIATYDPRLERYILHKQDYMAIVPIEGIRGSSQLADVLYYERTTGHNGAIVISFYIWSGTEYVEVFLNNKQYFENKSWTISYDYKKQSWISWYSFQPNYMFYNNNNFFSYISTQPSIVYKHGDRNFTSFYGNKYPMVTEFVITNLNTLDLHNIYWYARTELYDELNKVNKDVEKVTFDRLIAYTKKQSTGELRLNVRQENEVNLDWFPNLRDVVETDEVYKVSGLRNMAVDNNIFTSNWNDTDYNANFNLGNGYQGYIDKVNNATIYGSAEQEFLEDLKDKFFIIRLWRIPTSEDYKIIFNLAQTNLFYSIR